MTNDYRDLKYRRPYVGEGIEGALRSIEIDRSEIEGMPTPEQPGWDEQAVARRAHMEASIDSWRQQARIQAGALHGMAPDDAPRWARWSHDPAIEGFEYAVVRLDEGRQGRIVGSGPTDLVTAQEDARAWLDDGIPVRVVARPVAPTWTPVVD